MPCVNMVCDNGHKEALRPLSSSSGSATQQNEKSCGKGRATQGTRTAWDPDRGPDNHLYHGAKGNVQAVLDTCPMARFSVAAGQHQGTWMCEDASYSCTQGYAPTHQVFVCRAVPSTAIMRCRGSRRSTSSGLTRWCILSTSSSGDECWTTSIALYPKNHVKRRESLTNFIAAPQRAKSETSDSSTQLNLSPRSLHKPVPKCQL
eukprot:COSAG02_NODE_2_length_75708_cov_87.013953_51_plen_204_part_00